MGGSKSDDSGDKAENPNLQKGANSNLTVKEKIEEKIDKYTLFGKVKNAFEQSQTVQDLNISNRDSFMDTETRKLTSRKEYMENRKKEGKPYSEKNLQEVTKQLAEVNRVKDFADRRNENMTVDGELRGQNYKLSTDYTNAINKLGYQSYLDRFSSPDGPGDKSNINSVEQPKVAAQMNNEAPDGTTTGPTQTEMSLADQSLYNKRKGRKETVLTSMTGVEEPVTLSKKTLLG
tara:strand:+ start:986 stop:1684 length:699 start_codon:yes stop_codon:yes gene_type:complete